MSPVSKTTWYLMALIILNICVNAPGFVITIGNNFETLMELFDGSKNEMIKYKVTYTQKGPEMTENLKAFIKIQSYYQ
jgi:hypothetical protein